MKPESKLMCSIFGWGYDMSDGNYRQEDLRDALMEVLDSIASSATGWSFRQRYKQVILLRHGFTDGRARTLEEVGQEFGLSGSRIRQIELKALRLLRRPSISKRLKEFIIVKPRCGIG